MIILPNRVGIQHLKVIIFSLIHDVELKRRMVNMNPVNKSVIHHC